MGNIIIFRTDLKQAQRKGYTKRKQRTIQKAEWFKTIDEDAYLNDIHLTEEDWKWLDDFMNRFGKQ